MGKAFVLSMRYAAAALLAAQISLAVAPQTFAQATDPAQATELTPAEAAFEHRLRAAWEMMSTNGRFDDGYKQLREALAQLARTDLFTFTVTKYTEAGRIFQQNEFFEEGEAVFGEGEKTRAMQEDVKERPDFYLAYAQFKMSARDFARVVPLFTTATNLYAEYYGRESVEVINANDLLAVALASLGQYGTAANLFQGNYDLALRVLGPEDRLVWRLANNLADTLRGIGSLTRALELDLMVLEKRTAYYGQNHFNVLVSANNTAQDYLDLADYAGALRYFGLNRDIAIALRDNDPGLLPQVDAWILYTKLLSGEQPFNGANIATMDGLIADANFPTILSYKAARLLAEHFAASDAQRSMKHLEQALDIARSQMSQYHPLTLSTRRAIANAKVATDPAATAAEYEKLDADMMEFLAMQVMFAGSRDFADATRALADDLLYDYALLAEKNAAMVPAFADATRRWPTLEDGRRDTVRKLMRLLDPSDEELFAMLRRQLRLSMMNQEFFAAGSDEALAFESLEESQQLDDKINARLNEIGFDPKLLDTPLPTPRELLAEDEAFIAYFITRKWRPDRQSGDPFEDVRLYGIAWRRDQAPSLTYLGDPRAVGSQTPTAEIVLAARSDRGAEPIGGMDAVYADLHAVLIAPLEPALEDASTIFVVPDGQLFAVPFSLLEDGQGRLLEERFTIRLLTRPESLYGLAAEQTLATGGRATLAGGLDYTNGSEMGADPLPGTLREVGDIAALLGQDKLVAETFTGIAATEAALRASMESATVAHLATHGSYGSPKNGGASNVDTLWQSDVILSKSGDTRSMKRDELDGRLYAFELMTWDLSKLDLLVLSACDTGRGDETFVGGLRGLPTAINIAGARRSLLALWPVADEGTANFMTRYYEYLVGGMTYAGALRQARRDAIDGRIAGAENPRVWAAFVMFEN